MKKLTPNQRYNQERKAQSDLIKRDVDRDKLIEEIYKSAENRIQKRIDSYYLRYANSTGLTKQEAMKLADSMDVTQYSNAAAIAVRNRDFSEKTNKWLKVYNLKMKVSRLELLKRQLQLELMQMTASLYEMFDEEREKELEQEYTRQAGILGLSIGEVPEQLKRVLEADFYGATFSSRVWGRNGLQRGLQREIFSSLNRIYTDMDGYKKEMNRLSDKFQTSKYNAQRLLKTEIARINADTQLTMYKDVGFTHLIYVAEPGACDICGKLNKTKIPIDKAEKGVNMFPMHPNCRCSTFAQFELVYKDGRTNLDEFKTEK